MPAIVGIVEVVAAAYPDHSQFKPDSRYYDPKSLASYLFKLVK
jgi:predicted RNA-binding protein with PUA-like domain